MNPVSVINQLEVLRRHLCTAFEEVDGWFAKAPDLRAWRNPAGGWTVDEVLEHISLTNHFLLILIEKGTRKAVEAAQKAGRIDLPENYQLENEKLSEIAMHQQFYWMRPEHMEPEGKSTPAEVRELLQKQLAQCLNCLDRMPNGEGVLYKTTMTVNQLGKIDVYQYLFFLSQHAVRHIRQMEKLEMGFREH